MKVFISLVAGFCTACVMIAATFLFASQYVYEKIERTFPPSRVVVEAPAELIQSVPRDDAATVSLRQDMESLRNEMIIVKNEVSEIRAILGRPNRASATVTLSPRVEVSEQQGFSVSVTTTAAETNMLARPEYVERLTKAITVDLVLTDEQSEKLSKYLTDFGQAMIAIEKALADARRNSQDMSEIMLKMKTIYNETAAGIKGMFSEEQAKKFDARYSNIMSNALQRVLGASQNSTAAPTKGVTIVPEGPIQESQKERDTQEGLSPK